MTSRLGLRRVRSHRRGAGTFVREYSRRFTTKTSPRRPITVALTSKDPGEPGGTAGMYAYVDVKIPNTIFIDMFDPFLAGHRGEPEEKVTSRLLSHETFHAVLNRLNEAYASRRLDSEENAMGTFAPFERVTTTGLMRKRR